MSYFSRLRAANIPWLYHFTVLSCSPFLLHISGIRTCLLLYMILTIALDAEEVLKAFQDPSEPPLIPHPYLPFLGHVIGMFWHGAKYFDIVNRKTQYPIFTLQTLNARTIGVISPQLAAPIQRASKSTSFYGMILEVTKRLVDFDEPSMKIIRWNLDDELGHHEGLMNESHDMVASVLSPGPILNQISSTQLEKFAELLNTMAPGSNLLSISLMDFVKRVFTIANAFTIYGPQNPFAMHPELVQKFWDYEAGMIKVMADIVPSITARKPWLARKAINAALQEFIEKEHYRSASPLIQKRVAINLKHGLTTQMAGHAELILLFGIIGNAVPTTFWFLANVYSNPDLLEQIRKETSQAVLCSRNSDKSRKEKVINVTKLKTMCPLLVSTYRETLRLIGNLASVRLVTNTHYISAPGHPSYLLKKGSMIQIAAGVIHTSESVWGADAKTFNPTRFISSTTSSEQFSSETDAGVTAEKTATQLPKNVPSAAYRAFGGGSVICPGRHFAQSEILGFVALCVNMFDVTDGNGGVIDLPEKDDGRIPLSVMKPVKEPQVVIKRREGEEDVIWRLEL
ncbi:cytochrome P450 [Melanomma pulvis-pyrius CBS 109.77]|uniref:Cytochrome P450 n=1 Tax=Melanomma pulvis-pyrius CBS 109.77 TaxID=1314802 RepID=A0A6A6XBB8_9PLEO|nr:cytochrome P450 [Melanomma pulvis-pyrius CBS 109.77]